MGKSKFQAKAQVKVGVKSKVKRPKSKYYDEHISNKQSSTSSNSFAIFVIVCVIIGASVSGILIINNRQGEDPDPNGTGSGIKDGDTIVFAYELYVDENYDDIFANSEMVLEEKSFEWTVAENSEEDFPPGFYYNILGMVQGQTKDFVIPPNIDNDNNGIDDITGIPVWDSEHNLQQYNLKFIVEILEIK